MQHSILLLQHRYLEADHLGEIATTRLSTLHRTFILERCSSQAASNFTRSPSWKRWHHHLTYTQSSEPQTSHRNCRCSGLKCSSLWPCFFLILQCFCWLTCLVVGAFTSELLYDSHEFIRRSSYFLMQWHKRNHHESQVELTPKIRWMMDSTSSMLVSNKTCRYSNDHLNVVISCTNKISLTAQWPQVSPYRDQRYRQWTAWSGQRCHRHPRPEQ